MMTTTNCFRFFAFVAFTALFFSCGEGKEESVTIASAEDQNKKSGIITDPVLYEIRDMEARAKKDSIIDRTVGLRLLRAYQTYYNQHPQDSLGKAFLFEAARVADALGKYDKAIELLGNYHDGIENKNKKAEAAYLVAFIYDAHLKNEKKAIDYYNKVIQLYPDTPWAEQAKSALFLVGKNDEELLRFLKEKNKQAS
jgi:tetratricopeptide (TPR) repeat protein